MLLLIHRAFGYMLPLWSSRVQMVRATPIALSLDSLHADLISTYHWGTTISSNFWFALRDAGITRDGPFRATDGLCRLIQLSSHIQIVDGRLSAINRVEADQRFDL